MNYYLCWIFREFLRNIFGGALRSKQLQPTYCNSFNIKFRHGYFSANITKFSEQVSLKHLQEYIILLMSKSEVMLVRILYKKTDEWYIKWQRVVQRVRMSGTTNDNEWCNKWKQMRVILGFRMKQLCNVKLQYIQQHLFENVKQSSCRSSNWRCFIKKLLLAILQYSQENTWRPATLLKRDSNTSVFLWTLQNF